MDEGAIETIKESALVLRDENGVNIRIFESTLNQTRIDSKLYNSLKYYICPQANFYCKSPPIPIHQNEQNYFYDIEMIAYSDSSYEIAKKEISKHLSKFSNNEEFEISNCMLSKMTHGRASVSFTLLPNLKTNSVSIGESDQQISINDRTTITVPVPKNYKDLFEKRLRERTLSGELSIIYNSKNLNVSTFQYCGTEIKKSEYFKKAQSNGKEYFNFNQINDIVKNSFKEINATAYRDPKVPNELVDFSRSIFSKCLERSNQSSAIVESQIGEIEKSMLEGTGISVNEFKPVRILLDTFESIKNQTDHKIANKIISDKFGTNQNIKRISAKGSFGFGPFKASVSGSSDTDNYKSNHDYFRDNNQLSTFLSTHTTESGKKLKIYPIGLGLVENSILNSTLETVIRSISYYPISKEIHLLNSITILNDAQYQKLNQLDKKTGTDVFKGILSGTILAFGGGTAPEGYLLCDGSAVSRQQYQKLFTIIGIQYGNGDNINTFNLPDLRGRTPIGVGKGTGLTNQTLGEKIGSETCSLSINEIPTPDKTCTHFWNLNNGHLESPGWFGTTLIRDFHYTTSWITSINTICYSLIGTGTADPDQNNGGDAGIKYYTGIGSYLVDVIFSIISDENALKSMVDNFIFELDTIPEVVVTKLDTAIFNQVLDLLSQSSASVKSFRQSIVNYKNNPSQTKELMSSEYLNVLKKISDSIVPLRKAGSEIQLLYLYTLVVNNYFLFLHEGMDIKIQIDTLEGGNFAITGVQIFDRFTRFYNRFYLNAFDLSTFWMSLDPKLNPNGIVIERARSLLGPISGQVSDEDGFPNVFDIVLKLFKKDLNVYQYRWKLNTINLWTGYRVEGVQPVHSDGKGNVVPFQKQGGVGGLLRSITNSQSGVDKIITIVQEYYLGISQITIGTRTYGFETSPIINTYHLNGHKIGTVFGWNVPYDAPPGIFRALDTFGATFISKDIIDENKLVLGRSTMIDGQKFIGTSGNTVEFYPVEYLGIYGVDIMSFKQTGYLDYQLDVTLPPTMSNSTFNLTLSGIATGTGQEPNIYNIHLNFYQFSSINKITPVVVGNYRENLINNNPGGVEKKRNLDYTTSWITSLNLICYSLIGNVTNNTSTVQNNSKVKYFTGIGSYIADITFSILSDQFALRDMTDVVLSDLSLVRGLRKYLPDFDEMQFDNIYTSIGGISNSIKTFRQTVANYKIDKSTDKQQEISKQYNTTLHLISESITSLKQGQTQILYLYAYTLIVNNYLLFLHEGYTHSELYGFGNDYRDNLYRRIVNDSVVLLDDINELCIDIKSHVTYDAGYDKGSKGFQIYSVFFINRLYLTVFDLSKFWTSLNPKLYPHGIVIERARSLFTFPVAYAQIIVEDYYVYLNFEEIFNLYLYELNVCQYRRKLVQINIWSVSKIDAIQVVHSDGNGGSIIYDKQGGIGGGLKCIMNPDPGIDEILVYGAPDESGIIQITIGDLVFGDKNAFYIYNYTIEGHRIGTLFGWGQNLEEQSIFKNLNTLGGTYISKDMIDENKLVLGRSTMVDAQKYFETSCDNSVKFQPLEYLGVFGIDTMILKPNGSFIDYQLDVKLPKTESNTNFTLILSGIVAGNDSNINLNFYQFVNNTNTNNIVPLLIGNYQIHLDKNSTGIRFIRDVGITFTFTNLTSNNKIRIENIANSELGLQNLIFNNFLK
eukprot:gene510-642_t